MAILLLHKSLTVSENCVSISESSIPIRKKTPDTLPLDKLPITLPKPNGHSTKAKIKSEIKAEKKDFLENAENTA